jgi:hypothetical protein
MYDTIVVMVGIVLLIQTSQEPIKQMQNQIKIEIFDVM